MDIQIKTADYEKLCISDYEQDIWISIWHMKAHASIHLNKEQVTQLRDELNKYLEAVWALITMPGWTENFTNTTARGNKMNKLSVGQLRVALSQPTMTSFPLPQSSARISFLRFLQMVLQQGPIALGIIPMEVGDEEKLLFFSAIHGVNIFAVFGYHKLS